MLEQKVNSKGFVTDFLPLFKAHRKQFEKQEMMKPIFLLNRNIMKSWITVMPVMDFFKGGLNSKAKNFKATKMNTII